MTLLEWLLIAYIVVSVASIVLSLRAARLFRSVRKTLEDVRGGLVMDRERMDLIEGAVMDLKRGVAQKDQ